jgi:hypothetical protein
MSPPFRAEPTQVIEGQYLDPTKLMRLLRGVYGTSDEGKNNFHVEVGCPCFPYRNPIFTASADEKQLRLNRYKIYPLEHVDAPMLTKVWNAFPANLCKKRKAELQ